jgi:hypothetical protein
MTRDVSGWRIPRPASIACVFSRVAPYRSDVVALSAPRDYLCRRYGLHAPTLPHALRDNVEVRSGAEVRLAPFVITEGGRAAKTGES